MSNTEQNAAFRFSDEEMDIAKSTDLPDLLEHLGYQLKRIGRYYTTREMDSIRIKDRRIWKRYSNDTGGDAITFLQLFEGKDFRAAVEYLLDFNGRSRDTPRASRPRSPPEEEERPEFALPPANEDILTHLTTNFGSDSATAAMGIAFRVDLIPSNVCHGLSTGIMPLIGYNYASGDHKRMRDATFYIFKLSMAVIVTVTILYLIFAEALIGFFIQNEEVIAFGAIFLRGLCIALPFYCVDFVSAGVFQACGLGKYSMMLPIFRNAVLEIPAFFVLDRLFSVYGLPYAYIVSSHLENPSV